MKGNSSTVVYLGTFVIHSDLAIFIRILLLEKILQCFVDENEKIFLIPQG